MENDEGQTLASESSGCLKWLAITGCGGPLLVVLMFIGVWIWGSVTPMSDEQKASEIGTACYSAVKQQLKDPSSASLTDTGVTSEGENSWKVKGSGTATNSFGGTTSFTWSCTGFIDHEEDAVVSAKVD